jgi:hypothetical protein
MWDRVEEDHQARRAKERVHRSVRQALRVRFSSGEGALMAWEIVVVARKRSVRSEVMRS